MSSLPEVQRLFFESLHGEPDPALLNAVLPSRRLGAADRIEIYRGMYFWRLRDALSEDFSKLAAVLGEDPFSDLVRRYLLANPSRHPSLRHLGSRLPAVLRSDELAVERPWLPDLAALEWARVEAFDAPDLTPIDAARLREVPADRWPSLRFELAPCVRRLESAWTVHEVWADPSTVPPLQATTALRVWREAGSVYHIAMDAAERVSFAALAAGESFADLCEALGDSTDDHAPRLAGELLSRWLADGLIVAVSSS